MASGTAMPFSPRTAARPQPYSEPRAAIRRPGAGVALRDLAKGINCADMRYLFDRYGELTAVEVCGEEGMLWYEDERDAEWVVDKLEGFMFADKPLRLSLFRRPPTSVTQQPQFRSVPALAPAAHGRAAKLRIVDLSAEAWERAVAAASAAAPATYASTFKDDYGKLAGVIQYAHTDAARRAFTAVEALGLRASVLDDAAPQPSSSSPSKAQYAAPPGSGGGGGAPSAERSLSRGRRSGSPSRSLSDEAPPAAWRGGLQRSRSPSRRDRHRGRSRSRSPAREKRGRSPPRRVRRTPSPPPPPPQALKRPASQWQPPPPPVWQPGPAGRMPFAPPQPAYAPQTWQVGRPPQPPMLLPQPPTYGHPPQPPPSAWGPHPLQPPRGPPQQQWGQGSRWW